MASRPAWSTSDWTHFGDDVRDARQLLSSLVLAVQACPALRPLARALDALSGELSAGLGGLEGDVAATRQREGFQLEAWHLEKILYGGSQRPPAASRQLNVSDPPRPEELIALATCLEEFGDSHAGLAARLSRESGASLSAIKGFAVLPSREAAVDALVSPIPGPAPAPEPMADEAEETPDPTPAPGIGSIVLVINGPHRVAPGIVVGADRPHKADSPLDLHVMFRGGSTRYCEAVPFDSPASAFSPLRWTHKTN